MDFIGLALKGAPKILKARPGVLAPLAVGALGAVVAGVKGGVDLSQSKAVRKEAKAQFDAAIDSCEAVREFAELASRQYGDAQLQAHSHSVGRFADWLERNEKQVRRLNFRKVDGVRVRLPNIPKYVANAESVTSGLAGIMSAAGAGAAAPAAALWGISTFASASTGTTIASLSGVAAQNATLAALGGGALAVGGGGMAAGATVLSLTAVVPTLLVGGFTLGIVGAKQKTKSKKYVATVHIEIESLRTTEVILSAVHQRIEELNQLLRGMSVRCSTALSILESVDFDADLHASHFLQAYQLVAAVKEIINTPVLDPDTGEITTDSIKVLRKYA